MQSEAKELRRTEQSGQVRHACGSGTIVDRKPRRGRQLGCDLTIGRERRRQPTPTPNPHGKAKEETEGGDRRRRRQNEGRVEEHRGEERCRG